MGIWQGKEMRVLFKTTKQTEVGRIENKTYVEACGHPM